MNDHTTDATTDPTCICIAVRKASRRLTSRYDEALAPLGINLAQYSLLRNINRDGPLSLTALSEITELDRSTLGRNVRVLDRMGLCATALSADKREAAIALTTEGKRVLGAAIPIWRATQDDIHSRIGAPGAAQLEALLGAL
jgi:DNA-binding MarR family transcriptional regulator